MLSLNKPCQINSAIHTSHTTELQSSSSRKRQRRLPSLRIAHLVHTHIFAHLHIAHTLRRDENELPSHRSPRRLNHHAHALRAVDRVHENVKLVQTADGTAHGLPDGEQQAYGGEGLFASAQCLCLAARVGLLGHVRLDFDVEFLAFVVDDDAAAELALGEEVAEHEACSRRNVLAEHFPAVLALVERFLEVL